MGLKKESQILLEIFYDRPIDVQKAVSLLEKNGFKKSELVILKSESLIVRALRKILFWTLHEGQQSKSSFKIQLLVNKNLTSSVQETLKKYTNISRFSINP